MYFTLILFNFLFANVLSNYIETTNELDNERNWNSEEMVPKVWWRDMETNDTEVLETFASSNCGIKNGPSFGLIVGGEESTPNEWPWAIGIYRYGSFICGGSIINERYIMTAAHCVSRNGQTQPASSFQVLVGAHTLGSSGKYFKVERVIPHENYDQNYMQNDIALFRLSTPINFSQMGNTARPICLPSSSMIMKSFVGQISTVVGWGTTREGGQISQKLQQVQIPIISNEKCSQKYNRMNIRMGQICAAYEEGGRDSCQGDSGGSLTVPVNGKYYQLGVVSWGSGCARPGAPGVYTRVTNYLSWIARKISY
ncbi:hypothetical protein BLOT_004018 [Blomia tropicalis]|nr:hypothetical protein BLOT_004018 [Blomia tropicalis]